MIWSSILFMHGIHSHNVKVTSGSLIRYVWFKSKFVEQRNVDVWLPNGYSSKEQYAVLYMHDGQMLFDGAQTWNHSEWGVDETIGRLSYDNEIRKCLIVGIWNVPSKRYADYFPEKIIKYITEPERKIILTKQIKGRPSGDNYLKFIVKELKPFIDRIYSTLKGVENTFIIGSSMGGLISAYALCEPQCIWWGSLLIHSFSLSLLQINQQ